MQYKWNTFFWIAIFFFKIFFKKDDSTFTDENGFYSLDFETSRRGDYYRLHVEKDIDIWTYYYNPIKIDSIGKTNYQDLTFLHLFPTNGKVFKLLFQKLMTPI